MTTVTRTRTRIRTHAFTLAAAAFAGAALSLAFSAQAAGNVEVSFVKPESYADIGRSVVDRERHLDLLARHLRALGGRLPDGQTLKIEVLDIDLAGEEIFNRHLSDVRVLRGRADWPRMTLRYTLSAAGQNLKSGDEKIADMGYLMHGHYAASRDALAYELRMVDGWFDARFLGAAK